MMRAGFSAIRGSLVAMVCLAAVCLPHAPASAALVTEIPSAEISFFCAFNESSPERFAHAKGQTLYTFDSSEEAEGAVRKILAPTGLANNFVVRAGEVPNAAALMWQGKRHIVYSPQWMRKLATSVKNDWAATSVMAHELAHHLQGHTAQSGGSRPDTELEADHWSGFILAKLGASMADAQAAMSATANIAGSATHPGRSARLTAIAAGWEKGASRLPPAPPPSSQPTPPQPIPTPSLPTPPQPAQPQPQPPGAFDTRCVFANEPMVSYMVARNNDIIGTMPSGQSQLAARRTPATMPNCAWMYTGIWAPAQYCVVPTGAIAMMTPRGFIQIGQCVSLP